MVAWSWLRAPGIVPADGASRREGEHFGGLHDVDRPARLEENIEICRLLWTGEPVSFEGTFQSYDGLQIVPTPVQDPCPIWIAANPAPGRYWERSLGRVARLADGFQTCALSPGSLEAMVTDLHRLLGEHGKDPTSFPVMAYHNVHVGSDRRECLAETKRFLDAYYGPVFTEAMVESWTAAGTPDDCISHLRDLVAQGATEITIRLTSFDQNGQFKRLCEEILPQVV